MKKLYSRFLSPFYLIFCMMPGLLPHMLAASEMNRSSASVAPAGTIHIADELCVTEDDGPIQLTITGVGEDGEWSVAGSASDATMSPTGLLTIVWNPYDLRSKVLTIAYWDRGARVYTVKDVKVNFETPIDGPTAITISSEDDWKKTVSYSRGNNMDGGKWVSSDPAVATIDENGVLTPQSYGTTVVAYHATEGCFRNKASITLTVQTAGFISGPDAICTSESQPSQYQVTNTTPGGTWASSNEGIAVVDQSGFVTPKSGGSVEISYTPPGSAFSAVKVISVFAAGRIVGQRNLCLSDRESSLYVDGMPDGGQWISNNPDVVRISQDGSIELKSTGTSIITYTFEGPCGEISVSKTLVVGTLDGNINYDGRLQQIVSGVNPIIDDNCATIGTINSPSIVASYPFIETDIYVSGGNIEYDVRPDDGPDYAADLVFYYYQQDFDDFNKGSAIKLPTSPTDAAGILNVRIRHESPYYPLEMVRPTKVTWNQAQLRWEVAFSITHFSFFYLDAEDASLPVTLTAFEASKQEKSVVLNWSTSMETNSESFEIQHSADGKQWQKLGSVAAEGESKTLKTYAYLHKTPSVGNNFYRLKMIDRAANRLDKAFTYSRIRVVNFEHLFETRIYPNPTSDQLRIETEDWETVKSVKIVSMTGVTVYASARTGLSQIIHLKSIPAGVYVIEISLEDGKTKTSRIVIAR